MKPVLLVGGYGVTGKKTSLQLRKRFPDLPLAIAGRDLSAARAWAEHLGNAEAHHVDLGSGEEDLGLPHRKFSAMAVFLMDENLRAMSFAREHGIGYVGVTGGAFETGVLFAFAVHAAQRSPIVLAPHWFCGGAMMPALHLAQHFAQVSRLDLGILIDRNGAPSGAATKADFQRILGACSTMPVRTDWRVQWIAGDAGRSYTGIGGRILQGSPSVSIDVASLGAACGADDVHVLETWGESLSFLAGNGASDEIVIEMRGTGPDGSRLHLRQELVASRERSPLTPLFIAMLVEEAAGLSRRPAPSPGVYTPERLLNPDYAVRRMEEAGVEFGAIVEL